MSQQLTITPKQRIIGNVVSVIVFIATAVVLALSYFNYLGVQFDKIVLPVCLGCFGLIFVFQAIIQLNPVSMWLGWAFLVPAIVSVIANFTEVSYGVLYPLYIATPAVCCLMAMFFGKGLIGLLKATAVFLLAGAIFSLHSLGILELWIVLIIFFAYVLVFGIYVVLYLGKGDNK